MLAVFTVVVVMVILYQYQTCFSCDYYYSGPIDFVYGQRFDNLTIGEIVEIEFELQLNETCNIGYCHLLRIYNNDGSGERLPLINIPSTASNLRVAFSQNIDVNLGYNIYEPIPINDGIYHKYYFLWSLTQRIFTFDDNKTYYNNINEYDSSNYINKQYGLYLTDPSNQQFINGTIKNLCINSSWYQDTKPFECNYYIKNPMNLGIIHNNITDIIINEIIEISFDLQLNNNWICSEHNAQCNIISIGIHNHTILLINMLSNAAIYTMNSITDNELHFNESSINDGNYYRISVKWNINESETVFVYNNNITKITNNALNNISIAQWIGNEYPLVISDGNPIDGYIKNLCIKSYHLDITMQPTSVPTHSSLNSTKITTKYPSIREITNTLNPTILTNVDSDNESSEIFIYLYVGIGVIMMLLFLVIMFLCLYIKRNHNKKQSDNNMVEIKRIKSDSNYIGNNKLNDIRNEQLTVKGAPDNNQFIDGNNESDDDMYKPGFPNNVTLSPKSNNNTKGDFINDDQESDSEHDTTTQQSKK